MPRSRISRSEMQAHLRLGIFYKIASLSSERASNQNNNPPSNQCIACPRYGSGNTVKHGLLHNKYGDLQRYSCKDCNKRFVLNLGFEKIHASPEAITSAMQLYLAGESLRNVQNFPALQGVSVNHVTVYRWIGKYTKLMQKYLEKLHFNSSNI